MHYISHLSTAFIQLEQNSKRYGHIPLVLPQGKYILHYHLYILWPGMTGVVRKACEGLRGPRL